MGENGRVAGSFARSTDVSISGIMIYCRARLRVTSPPWAPPEFLYAHPAAHHILIVSAVFVHIQQFCYIKPWINALPTAIKQCLFYIPTCKKVPLFLLWKEDNFCFLNKKVYLVYSCCNKNVVVVLAGPGAGAQGAPVDHDHHPRAALPGLWPLHPGRIRPLQGHDRHRLQLGPPRADWRQLGRGKWPGRPCWTIRANSEKFSNIFGGSWFKLIY